MENLQFNKTNEMVNIKINKDSNLILQELLDNTEKSSTKFIEDILERKYKEYKDLIIDLFYENIIKENLEKEINDFIDKLGGDYISSEEGEIHLNFDKNTNPIRGEYIRAFSAYNFYMNNKPVSKENIEEFKNFIKNNNLYDEDGNLIEEDIKKELYRLILKAETIEQNLKKMHFKGSPSFNIGKTKKSFFLETKIEMNGEEHFCNIDVVKGIDLKREKFINKILFLSSFYGRHVYVKYYFDEIPKFLFIVENENTLKELSEFINEYDSKLLKHFIFCLEKDIIEGKDNFIQHSLVDNSFDTVKIKFI